MMPDASPIAGTAAGVPYIAVPPSSGRSADAPVAVAQLVIAEGDVEISAAVLVSPLVQLRPAVEAIGRRFGVTYLWSGASLDVAGRLDFVARADQLAKRGQPAVLLVVGTEDDPAGFRQPAERLHAALSARYADPQRAR